jgi:hypothetical protein
MQVTIHCHMLPHAIRHYMLRCHIAMLHATIAEDRHYVTLPPHATPPHTPMLHATCHVTCHMLLPHATRHTLRHYATRLGHAATCIHCRSHMPHATRHQCHMLPRHYAAMTATSPLMRSHGRCRATCHTAIRYTGRLHATCVAACCSCVATLLTCHMPRCHDKLAMPLQLRHDATCWPTPLTPRCAIATCYIAMLHWQVTTAIDATCDITCHDSHMLRCHIFSPHATCYMPHATYAPHCHMPHAMPPH